MNQVSNKIIVCISFTIILIILSLMTNDIINSKIFASFGIILGAFTFHQMSIQNKTNYDNK